MEESLAPSYFMEQSQLSFLHGGELKIMLAKKLELSSQKGALSWIVSTPPIGEGAMYFL